MGWILAGLLVFVLYEAEKQKSGSTASAAPAAATAQANYLPPAKTLGGDVPAIGDYYQGAGIASPEVSYGFGGGPGGAFVWGPASALDFWAQEFQVWVSKSKISPAS